MSNNYRIINHENINGVDLSLKLENRMNSPNSQRYTISYKNKEQKSAWPLKSFFLAVIFNALALCFVRISVQAILTIIIVLSFLVFFWITHSVQSESILVIPTVGVQSSVKYVFGREDNFVPWASIDDVIINEVFKLNRVIYILTLLVKPSTSGNNEAESVKLIPLFKYTKPRLLMLEAIYSELQSLLLASQCTDCDELGAGDKTSE
ncbi:phosphatidylinositol N-acetylglucosaminyltransferase subunit H [Bicyclus anynana]|uniref:Phosphatidylinositol N-acetylglucosaminyltransferase subunit H n=1 Tax=Bicyclus anynana TaxID=110368 RepID=A0A6J1N4H1_BICAN|nr:phosphatidylinositol N-acetylglucosaminyltransferase subunit H [Bicyclus anynana]